MVHLLLVEHFPDATEVLTSRWTLRHHRRTLYTLNSSVRLAFRPPRPLVYVQTETRISPFYVFYFRTFDALLKMFTTPPVTCGVRILFGVQDRFGA